PPTFTQAPSGTTPVSGAFMPLPQQHATIDLRISQFNPLIAEANPSANLDYADVSAWPEPSGRDQISEAVAPSLFTADTSTAPSPPTTDMTVDVDYGNPFPASWGVIGSSGVCYHMILNVPWTGYPLTNSGCMWLNAPLDMLTQ